MKNFSIIVTTKTTSIKNFIAKCAHEGQTFLVFTAKKPNKPTYYFIFVKLDRIKIFKIN